jgi:hypothetical protein
LSGAAGDHGLIVDRFDFVVGGPPYVEFIASSSGDAELIAVARSLLGADPTGSRAAGVIRSTLDQLLDGRRDGRWNYNDLHKTEKTHMGTLVEINLHREFGFADGDATDYRIAGIEVDCKFSQRLGGWEIGPEIVGHLCLVVWASDSASQWQAGLVRATPTVLRERGNRDGKRRLTPEGLASVVWLWGQANELAANLLLHLDAETREAIMTATGRWGQASAQARLLELCRRVQGVILRRAVVETVGWGTDDPLKRMRSNGGARDYLRPEGILVLGHQQNDPLVAAALGLPVPSKGEFVTARVVVAEPDGSDRVTEIADQRWRVARTSEPVVAAPAIPRG